MVGKRIHEARKASGITLDSLAERVGVSKGHLSQIEREQADPSIAVLRKVSEELGIAMHQLFDEAPSREVSFVPREKRTRITYGDSPVTFELVTLNRQLYAQDVAFDVMACNVMPRVKVLADLPASNCEELIYVVAGQIDYHAEDEVFFLATGDSIFVPDNTGHFFCNSGMDMAELIVILAPRQEGTLAPSAARRKTQSVSGDGTWSVAGEKIRQLRQERNLKVNDFAELLGISATHVSRLERDLIEPSLSVLRKVASVLDVTIPALLASSFPSDIVVTTRDTRKRFAFSDQESHVSHCFCTPDVLGDGRRPAMQVYLSEIEARQMDNRQYALHEKSDEVMVLLAGNLEVVMEHSSQLLNRGDGLLIPRGVQHRLYNPGGGTVQVLGVLLR